jgi:hypothetical protein
MIKKTTGIRYSFEFIERQQTLSSPQLGNLFTRPTNVQERGNEHQWLKPK